MNNLFFVYNNTKYIVELNENKPIIYKEVDGIKQLLSEEEKDNINKLLNSKYSYIYDSTTLSNLVFKNSAIDKKEYIINFLNWLEKIIPQDCRTNLYRNVQTLRTTTMPDTNLQKSVTYYNEDSRVAGYNTSNNVLMINDKSLQELWKLAQQDSNPNEFYYRHYAKTILHELAHMASSNYNNETGVSLCGFDRYPAQEERDKNRGLTEGFTEILSIIGVPNTAEISSNYYIEASIINQLVQIIGYESFIRAYFSNLRTEPMEDELNELIEDPIKCNQLFRDIELNYNVRDLCSSQNILGNIQLSLLDYFDRKLELMSYDSTIEEISSALQAYESMMITPEKLKMININPQDYLGVADSIAKFDAIKTKCLLNLRDNKKGIA